MTPKEKADNLISLYLWPQRHFNQLANIKVAKECALIAVDETISQFVIDKKFIRDKVFENEIEWFLDARVKYWNEVKTEIIQL